MSSNSGLARIGAVFYVLWRMVHYNAAYGVYQLAQSAPLTMEHGRLERLAFYLASFATAGIVLATLNWRNSRLGFWCSAVVIGIGDIPFILFVRASVARDRRSGSVDRSLRLHRNPSGAIVRHGRWGETRKVKMLTTEALHAVRVMAPVTSQPQRGEKTCRTYQALLIRTP
jgi:hypothetical protein